MCQPIQIYLFDVENFLILSFVHKTKVRNEWPLSQIFDILMFTANRLEWRINLKISLRILGYFMNLDVLSLQILDKRKLVVWYKEETFSLWSVPSSSSNSVHVYVRMFRNINLKDPIYFWKIKSSCCDICAEQHSMLFLAKSKVYSHPFGLFLMALKFIQRWAQFELSKGLIKKTNLFACRQKNNYFLFLMALEKRIKCVNFILGTDNHIVLHQFGRSLVSANPAVQLFFVSTDTLQKQFLWLAGANIGKVHNSSGHCSRKHESLNFRDVVENSFKMFFETHLKHDISFIQNQHLKIISLEPICFL